MDYFLTFFRFSFFGTIFSLIAFKYHLISAYIPFIFFICMMYCVNTVLENCAEWDAYFMKKVKKNFDEMLKSEIE